MISSALRLLRAHLGLDVAFVSQLTADVRVFRYLDADEDSVIEVGDADPVEDSFCHHVVRGTVPEFLDDPREHPVTRELEATWSFPVGTHFSVPLVFSDGSVYGTFCGFRRTVGDDLSERDLDVVRLLAGMVVGHVEQAETQRRALAERRRQLQSLAPSHGLSLEVQPIVELATGAVVGVEALARFPTLGLGPAEVFAEAWQLDIGVELELTAVRLALDLLPRLGDGRALSINVAPDTLTDDAFLAAVAASSPHRLVVELTEHTRVGDYAALVAAIARLQDLGGRLAIDDVGTGFSGLDHILRLEPDILKVDGALVRDLDSLPGKQAMVAALVTFAGQVGATVVAEQVETASEVGALLDLGVELAQGYHLGRPAPLDALDDAHRHRQGSG